LQPTISYLTNLTLQLSAGIAGLPEEVRSRHAEFLIAEQREDGGFAGRKGASDLYYTAFALRSLAMMGEIDDRMASRVTGFLESRLADELPGIDFLSLITSAVIVAMATGRDAFGELGIDGPQAVIDFFEPLRRDDGGYAKTARSGSSSTYHTFLVVACKQMVEAPLSGTDRMIELVCSRQRDDGGFVEIAPMRHSGTNPTAAAVGLLRLLDALDPATATAAVEFLAHMQTTEGGFRANTQIPVADLLSTFTALVALRDLETAGAIDAPAALRFAESLEQPDGGFRAGTWDDAVDVEYTFYGLGTLGLLTA